MNPEYLLIDGTGAIMGRLASIVAKLALLGNHVLVINAKDIVISGHKQSIFDHYIQKRNIKTRTNPHAGPFFYRTPDKLFRRTVRGMVPRKTARGSDAYARVHVRVAGYDKEKYPRVVPYTVPNIDKSRLSHTYITLETLSNRFGWKFVQE